MAHEINNAVRSEGGMITAKFGRWKFYTGALILIGNNLLGSHTSDTLPTCGLSRSVKLPNGGIKDSPRCAPDDRCHAGCNVRQGFRQNMKLPTSPPPPDEWPEDLRYLYFERVAIRHFDGGQELEDAKVAALAETWGKL